MKNKKLNVPRVKKVMIIADLFAFLVAIVMISACHMEAPSMVTITEPEFERTDRLVYKDDILEAKILNAENCSVVWESKDESVAEILSDGKIKGAGLGKTEVTALVINQETAERKMLTMTVEVFRKEVPSDSDLPYWYEDEIFLINNDNPVSSDFEPKLVNVRKSIPTAHKETKLTPDCEEALAEMYSDYLDQNLGTLRLISTYRSYAKQEQLLKNAIKQRMADYGMTEEQARAHALKTRTLPGCSEHHSGLAIDFSTVYTTQNKFHQTKQGKWLTENAHKYGFVLRYPKDKVDITQINYEPWHFRFIEADHSLEHAKYIYEHGICLEEYVELQKKAKEAAEKYAKEHPLEA